LVDILERETRTNMNMIINRLRLLEDIGHMGTCLPVLTLLVVLAYATAFLFLHSFFIDIFEFYSKIFFLSLSNNMCETELIITLDNDDELINLKDSESCTSPNSLKTKRSRLTFPFGAW
jgi:hypothetical protein